MLSKLRGILKNGLFGGGSASKAMAKSRLHFVLVQDRTGLSNNEMAAFKRELISVIEKYFVIDEQGFDISYQRETDLSTLLINSPIVVRRQDGFHGQVGARTQSNVSAAADTVGLNSAPQLDSAASDPETAASGA